MRVKVAAVLFIGLVGAAVASASDVYDLNAKGWLRKPIQGGELLSCSVCENAVQVQITVGPQMPPGNPMATNSSFATRLAKESDQRALAETLVRESMPVHSGVKLSITRVGMVKMGGLQVLQLAAVVEMGRTTTRDTTYVTVNKGRFIKISVNYYDGDLTPKAGESLRMLFDSIRFI